VTRNSGAASVFKKKTTGIAEYTGKKREKCGRLPLFSVISAVNIPLFTGF
jgi:hypothetical protein